jgi:N-methylhydantoinase A
MVSSEGDIDGYPLRLPMIDVKTIGAGGGSIAWLDSAGVLKVGPQSAGARPGPVCYGAGGTEPTVTDASLLLGYIHPESFAGGIQIDKQAAEHVIAERIGAPLGLDAADAALGIHRIVNSRMAQTLRLVTIERGEDPRDFVLVAIGGAGPVHAGRLAAELGIPKVVIPRMPGVSSARGLLHAPIEHEFSRTFRQLASSADLEQLRDVLGGLDDVCAGLMRRDGIADDASTKAHFAEMRYQGQSHELEVPLESPLRPDSLPAVVGSFHEFHQRMYSYAKVDEEVEFVVLRAVHSSPAPALIVSPVETASLDAAPVRQRRACFDSSAGFVTTPVFRRAELPVGKEILGPAIVEQEDTTCVIFPAHRAVVDAVGNLIVHIPSS